MAGKRKQITTKKPNSTTKTTRSKTRSSTQTIPIEQIFIDDYVCEWIGEPIPEDEAKLRWPLRYQDNPSRLGITRAKRHYMQVLVEEEVYSLNDDAMIQGEPGNKNYICKIIEFFESMNGVKHFTSQWYYRANETVIKERGSLISDRRIFFSDVMNENLFHCLVEKAVVTSSPFEADEKEVPLNHFYCDMRYLIPFSTFVGFSPGSSTNSSESCSTVSSVSSCVDDAAGTPGEDSVKTESSVLSGVDDAVGSSVEESVKTEKTLLDLYAGCGAMSTGLCMGARIAGENLVTKWAVDVNEHACASLRLNHPETQVRHEHAEDFLGLIKEWYMLCTSDFATIMAASNNSCDESSDSEGEEDDENEEESGVYEVEEILDICYGDPRKTGKHELHFLIRWKGYYGPNEDTWEPRSCLISCEKKLMDFVSSRIKSKFLPLPGTVDVICGGPPCQGLSGFNRFRDKKNPLGGNKNNQLLVFMEIIRFLKLKFVLMENVLDLLKFSKGYVGRHALGCLVSMGYQARVGIMAAGNYGLPQYRMRVFLWGALPTECLPQYPLPTHQANKRGVGPVEFKANLVECDEHQKSQLKNALCLQDAISDLPKVIQVSNKRKRDEIDEIPYELEAKTEFQRFIRQRRDEMPGCLEFNGEVVTHLLYDHSPLCLNNDDYERVCQIPKEKGANFRNLPGVIVGEKNIVEFDEKVERYTVSSGKYLVPNYAMSFVRGKSLKPFGRIWWDEIVPTVVGRAEPHNQIILHPEQDRVLTIRENARLQGFPDFYKLIGPTKQRYVQVGNAVAVPVARALGVSLAMAMKGSYSEEPVFNLPERYLS